MRYSPLDKAGNVNFPSGPDVVWHNSFSFSKPAILVVSQFFALPDCKDIYCIRICANKSRKISFSFVQFRSRIMRLYSRRKEWRSRHLQAPHRSRCGRWRRSRTPQARCPAILYFLPKLQLQRHFFQKSTWREYKTDFTHGNLFPKSCARIWRKTHMNTGKISLTITMGRSSLSLISLYQNFWKILKKFIGLFWTLN